MIRDPVVYFTLLVSVVLLQAFIWIIGRHSTDADWWKSFALAVLATVGACVISYFLPRAAEVVATAAAVAFAGWLLVGFLYDELDWPHKLAISVAIPLTGYGTLIGVSALWIQFLKHNT